MSEQVETKPLSSSELRMTIEFRPEQSDLEKAVAAFDASLLFYDLIEGITEDAGARGKVIWDRQPMVFNGADIDAQPIFDALVAAYEKGVTAALAREKAR